MLIKIGFHSYGMAALTRILRMSNEEVDKVCSGGLNAVKIGPTIHTRTCKFCFSMNSMMVKAGMSDKHIVYGRKPEESK